MLNFRIFFRVSLFCLLGWFTVFANYGLIELVTWKKELRQLTLELTKLTLEKEELLKKTQALRGPEIDLDLLEIQVRKILAFAHKNELVYFWK